MDEMSPPDDARQTPFKRALATIRSLREQLEERQGRQPIAVVGAGLRLPGGIAGLGGYWDLLAAGGDAVRPMPAARMGPFAGAWAGLPQRGGFLDEVLDFDAAFFGISPREARGLDPQHRLLLEVTWEALEDAALPADVLARTETGLYLGIMWQDYREWLTGDPDAYWTTGNGHNFAAGRIAYTLGLTGPAMAVDTACSSSLVAVHLAVQALRRGECGTAIAAGVNLIMSPRSTRLVRETRSLAPDGLCKAFDARANGFTRGEGCGAIVLKRLDHALRDGDRVHAVIHGSAVNQDGRSGGFTAPNVLSQVALLERAMADAGVEPADIGYVEAHGTGTSLGDPIEMEALATAIGRRSGGAPLTVGAVKTNFGHLESAAGIAGLLKAVLCLRHRAAPPVVHLRTLNPRIDLSGTAITVPTELAGLDPASGAYAGVSSFGMSGTNAHVILAAPAGQAPAAEPARVDEFEISAKTPGALRALAGSYADRVEGLDPADYPAFAYTATHGRTRHEVRARVTAPDPAAAATALRAIATGEPSAGDDEGADPPDTLPRRVIDLPPYPWQRTRHAPAHDTPEPPPPAAYELAWDAADPDETPLDTAALVLAGDDADLLGLLAREAAEHGRDGTILAPAPTDVPPGWTQADLPTNADTWREFWTTRPASQPAVLILAPKTPLPGDPDPAAAPDTATATPFPGDAGPAAAAAVLCSGVTVAVGAAGGGEGGVRARVFLVTRAARRVDGDDQVVSVAHGALHGLAPVLGLETGGAWGGVVDLPAEPGAGDARALLALVAAQAGPNPPAVIEDLAAVRGGRVRAARLRAAPGHVPDLPVRDDATYLVTGGLGAVGREITADLVRRGARSLLLIGRRDPDALDAGDAAFLAGLREAGARIAYRGGGCETPDALAAACAGLQGLPPVRGVVHAAGSADRLPLARLDTAGFETALLGKLAGAWRLHEAARDWPLDFFVLVSSVSAVWGTEGYGAYSAANGALDALAAHRLSLGRPAASIAYGPWALAGTGMADEAALRRYGRIGVGALTAEQGRAALTGRAAGPAGHVLACPLDPPRFAEVMSGLRPRGLYTGMVPGAPDAAPGAAPGGSALLAELAALPERSRPAAATAHVRRLVAEQLGHADPAAVADDTGFFELGVDSIMALDLVARLSAEFGTDLQSADVFDHPTVAELAAHILARPTTAPPQEQPGRGAPPPAAGPTTGAPEEPPGWGTPLPVAGPTTGVLEEAPGRGAPLPVARPTGAAVPHAAAAGGEPIAIVGMAGRFPGADSVEELRDLLRTGGDGVTTVPRDRWDAASFTGDVRRAGRITTDQGGFLRDIDRFDAAFFDIPVREADNLDPQQRLLLESAWHALEDAGIGPHGLRGTRTGVFTGVSYGDYARVLARGGPEHIDAYYSTGTALNAAAGRIAYLLGLAGPAVAVDTACSSSLVAVHLAVRSLRGGETDAVLAGGVNVILDPMSTVAVSRAHMLSPTGRCRAFSADANGFVRAEGCGVLVLKRLSDARRDGDRVLAVILGSGVNQDGASSGLTAPSGTAQEAMLRTALADAGVPGARVSYLEAHGTGTSLGDPVEIGAAWRVLGEGRRPDEPLRVGSVKSNVGHCESAAGAVALIKTVLALRDGVIPANLHFREPNPHVDWSAMNVEVVAAPAPWPRGDRPRVAGVSGFGFTGTNAHIVLADPADAPPGPGAAAGGAPYLVPLSAPDADGLARLSDAWAERLESATEDELGGLAAVAATGRAHFPYRRALLGADRDALLAALRAPAPRDPAPRSPRVAFLFAGQGSQYLGMARELYETEPVFRDVFDRCDRVLEPLLGASQAELALYGDDPKAIDETRVTQPALVTLELALAALWESWGVAPAVVMGHSVGEIAAAIHAGVLDLEAGLTLIAERARLMQGTERGAMVSVVAAETDAAGWAADHGLDLAAVNGPESVVVSGAPAAADAFVASLAERGVRHRRLSVSHAFHSRLLDPVLAEFTAAAERLETRAPQVPIISNLTGRLAGPGAYDAGYWARHARDPVRFHAGARRLAELGVDACLEIGPDRTLANLVKAAGLAPSGGAHASLRRRSGDRAAMRTAAAALYRLGQDLTWARILPPHGGDRPPAPRYPFARTRHWADVPGHAASGPGLHAAAWGTELRSPGLRGRVFATERSTAFPAHLTDHRLFGTVSVPGASQTATVLSALGADGSPLVLADLHFPRALVLRDGERYEMQIIDAVQDHGTRTVSVQSLVDPDRDRWQEHLAARIVPADGTEARPVPDADAFVAGAERRLSGDDFYRHLWALGYHLGPSFRWIRDIWISGDEALVRYAEPAEPSEDPAGYEIHPGLLDSVLQSTVAFAVGLPGGDPAEQPALGIPFAAARLAFPGRPVPGRELWGHVRATRRDRGSADLAHVEAADLHLFYRGGATVLAVDGFRFRRAPRALLERSLRESADHAYTLTWAEREAPAADAAEQRWHVAVTDPDGRTAGLRAELESLGHRVADMADGAVPDLVVDARFLAVADTGPGDALASALALTEQLRTAPRDVPYALLCEEDEATAPVRESLYGLLAALEAEQPDRRLLRITLAAGWDDATLAGALTRSLNENIPETRLKIGPGDVQVARLTPAGQSSPLATPAPTTGAALVTGGLGALGLSVAGFLAGRGVRSIALMGRSAPDEAARRVIDELTARGVRVHVVHGDVTEPQACRRAVAEAARDLPLRTVLHLAGVSDDHAFEGLTEASFETVFAAKARGAANLAAALAGHELDAFVLFSSASAVLGTAGQANYAAANGYLGGLAESLRAAGVPATAIDWGAWIPRAKGGMAASAAAERAAARGGVRALSDEEAEELLWLAVDGGHARLAAVALDPDRYLDGAAGHPRAALLARPAGPRAAARVPERPRGWLAEDVAGADPQDREERLRDAVEDMVTEVLGAPAPAGGELGFGDLGLDSIMVIDLRTRLSHAVGLDLDATVALDHPTAERLAAHVTGLLFPPDAETGAETEADVPGAPSEADPADLSFDELIEAVRADLQPRK
ncbi:SDR family NAD(P)-dependent oxidoreductase [Spirillospora sp. NPDC047418]